MFCIHFIPDWPDRYQSELRLSPTGLKYVKQHPPTNETKLPRLSLFHIKSDQIRLQLINIASCLQSLLIPSHYTFLSELHELPVGKIQTSVVMKARHFIPNTVWSDKMTQLNFQPHKLVLLTHNSTSSSRSQSYSNTQTCKISLLFYNVVFLLTAQVFLLSFPWQIALVLFKELMIVY